MVILIIAVVVLFIYGLLSGDRDHPLWTFVMTSVIIFVVGFGVIACSVLNYGS